MGSNKDNIDPELRFPPPTPTSAGHETTTNADTGIFPFDPNIVSDDDLLCSKITSRPSLVLRQNTTHSNIENSSALLQLPERLSTQVNIDNPLSQSNEYDTLNFQKPFVNLEEFRVCFKAGTRKNTRKMCNDRKSEIATETPEKEQLEIKGM